MKVIQATAALICAVSVLFAADEREKVKFPEQNLGTTDRIIRAVVGSGLATAGTYMIVKEDNTKGAIPLGISVVPLLTASFGRCPLYYPFGFSTKKNKKQDVSIQVIPGEYAQVQYHRSF